MEELLSKINATFDNCIAASSVETQLQLKILKNNINALFNEYSAVEDVPTIDMPVNAITANATPAIVDSRKKILIVDDSSIVRNFLTKTFSDEFCVLTATDGQDAINKLGSLNDSTEIQLLLLDLMMPVVDGFGVLEYLVGNNINIPVMIISVDNSKDTINRAFQYNVVDVIEKPFDARKIKDKIVRFINL